MKLGGDHGGDGPIGVDEKGKSKYDQIHCVNV